MPASVNRAYSYTSTVRTRQNESVLSLSARGGEEERKNRLGDLRDCFRLLADCCWLRSLCACLPAAAAVACCCVVLLLAAAALAAGLRRLRSPAAALREDRPARPPLWRMGKRKKEDTSWVEDEESIFDDQPVQGGRENIITPTTSQATAADAGAGTSLAVAPAAAKQTGDSPAFNTRAAASYWLRILVSTRKDFAKAQDILRAEEKVTVDASCDPKVLRASDPNRIARPS
jgi:hypothetical protein